MVDSTSEKNRSNHPPFPEPGSIIKDKYFCLGRLGKGTFCAIHKCVDLSTHHNNTTSISTADNDEDDTNPNTLVDKEDSNICPPMKSGVKRLVIANDKGKQKGAKGMHLSTRPLHIEDGTNVVNMKSTHERFAIKLKDKRKFQEEDDNIGPSVKRPANASAVYEPPLIFTSLATAGQLVNNAAMLPNAVQALLPGGSVPEL